MTIRQKIRLFVTEQRWTLGFIENPVEDIVTGKEVNVRYIKGQPKDRWYADPFILCTDNDTIVLLVEEFLYETRLGRISKLIIRKKDLQLISDEVVLELNSHLSFPAIKREGGKVYIYPENAGGLGLALYEYDMKQNTCTYIKTISSKPLADAIITDVFDEELMFTTQIPKHNGNELSVYRFNNDGQPILFSTCHFESDIARNAGDWFKVGDTVYRPAQDCNGGYGKAVILQKIQHERENFVFNNIRRIESNNTDFSTGCHTFNVYNGLTVIDVHGYVHSKAASLYTFFRKVFSFLIK